ncbi:piwi-like protein Ago3 isoform X1 [Bombyx mori]|uniref:Piwi-like protein Ago3 n=1 Tax=Bombyx mori TaxID=7091 RepID=A0A8R2GC50_BOMMO|nr:piwi-like protein Ago3 [Bombyx mori]XP_012550549.1 piwi-like protein Ago3 isoform X1 [Bombyx mori]BAF73717.2 argonaute 3 [Bombyx mori]
MADPGKGRGRSLALLQALKKSQMMDSPSQSESQSPESTPEQSTAPSTIASATPSTSGVSIGGRGRAAALMLAKMQQKPGSTTPAIFVPPSSTSAPTAGTGRGFKLLQSLQASQKASSQVASSQVTSSAQSDIKDLTEKMSETSVSAQTSSVAKNKYFREVKDTPPVVKKGETGVPIEVTCNYIYLNFKENIVFEYEVKFEPDQDYKHLRFKLLNEHIEHFKEKTFDGTTLYVPHELPDAVRNLVSTNPYDQSKVNVSIIFRRTRRLSEMIHIYNVMFKCIMKDLKLIRFGRQHYNEHAAIQIPQHKLEVWPGYVTAVDEYEGGLMLTLDSTHRVLRTQTVLSLIKEVVQTEGANWKRKMTDILIGASVMTTYNKKLFRVDTIDDKMSPRSTFEKTEKGETVQISFIDYYKKNYGIEIMDWDQPLLISRDTKRMPGSDTPTDFMICLIPELCQLTGLTDDQRSNFRLMKDVATYTRITPNQRHAAFKKYIESVMKNETAKSRLAGWGLSIAPETVNLTARTLPPETLYFGDNVRVPGKPNAEWNSEVTKHSVMQAVDIMRWVLLFTQRDKQVAMDFLSTLKRNCRPMGIMVSDAELVPLANDRTDTYVLALKKCITSSVQLVVAICSTKRDDRYAAIKKVCCADNPVPSQVINARTLMNTNKIRSITQKILLQLNCKLGGTLWSISIPFKSAMIVGIDSYHDPSRRNRSVCSFVASYNQSMTLWYSKVIFQEKGQEIVDGLKCCLVDALTHYLRSNGQLPDRIIIYRDGVGDGQLKLLQQYEIPQMKICFTILGSNYQPTLTYVVVQKRINTRIFLKSRDGYDNPNPGTVVDHCITRRDWYDFLIVSQKVTQGTVTPTHYVVVYDDSGITPDQCQRLTYKMCHLYYNWPGTVRVPAPCQYAHKLSYLVGQCVHAQPSDVLVDKLFFL